MRAEYADLIRRRLEVSLVEGPDKTATLADALRRAIEIGRASCRERV